MTTLILWTKTKLQDIRDKFTTLLWHLQFVLVHAQVDKFLPLYKRKKALQEQHPPPVVFEMFPHSGMLSPGERVNVHIKFSPADGVSWFWYQSNNCHCRWKSIMEEWHKTWKQTGMLTCCICLSVCLQQTVSAASGRQRPAGVHHSSGSGWGSSAWVLPISSRAGVVSPCQHRCCSWGYSEKPLFFPHWVLLPGVWHTAPPRRRGRSMFSEVSEVMWQINFQFTLFSLGAVNLLQLFQMY